LAAGLVTARALSTTLVSEATLADQTMAGPPPAEAELRRADQLASEGDLRGALHHRYLAALRRLDERGGAQQPQSPRPEARQPRQPTAQCEAQYEPHQRRGSRDQPAGQRSRRAATWWTAVAVGGPAQPDQDPAEAMRDLGGEKRCPTTDFDERHGRVGGRGVPVRVDVSTGKHGDRS